MKVKVITRQVYHKYAEVKIEVPNMECNDIHEYLLNNENMYTDKLDEALSKAEYEHGTGVYNYSGMEDAESDSEWRFEYGDNYGGHL